MLRNTLKSLWAHKRRLVSTTISVILGVAFMAGTLVLGDTLDRSIDGLVNEATEGIDAEVRGPELFDTGFGVIRGPIDQSLADVVAGVEGVTSSAPYIYAEGARVLDGEGEPIGQTNGAPTLLESYIDDATLTGIEIVDGRSLQADDEMIINRNAADEGDLTVGSSVEIATTDGIRSFTLVGIYEIIGQGSIAGAVTVSLDLGVVQEIAGTPDQILTIFARSDDLDQQALVDAIAAALPDGTDAEVISGEQSAEELSDSFTQFISIFTTFLLVFAVIALLVGCFIIYNTFSILVAQRGKELALLRAIGATRRQVLASVLIEAAIVGIVASAIGIGVGILLANGIYALLNSIGLELPSSGTIVASSTIIVSFVVGTGVTFFSAIVPAWRATRVAPIAALRDVAQDTSGSSWVRAAVGAVVFLIAVFLMLPAFGDDPDTGALQSVGFGAAAMLVSLIVLGPIIARPFSKLLGSPISALRGVPGHLARENAARSPKRTAATAAALMIGVALVGFITIFASSTRESIDAELTRGLKADLIVQSASFDSGIPLALTDEIRGADGVQAVGSMRQYFAKLEWDGGDVTTFVGAVEPDEYREVIDVRMEVGELTDLTAGGIIVDRAQARDRNIAVGDTLTATLLGGSRIDVTVVAISDDPTLLGSYTLSLEDWEANVPSQSDAMVFVLGDSGTDVTALHATVSDLAEAYPTVQVRDRDEFLGSVVNQINALLNVVYGLLALSILIALIGIANTLALSIHERTRELGLLRAVGMTRSQLRSAVRWEAAIISLVGTVLGLALAVGLSYTLVKGLSAQGLSAFTIPVASIVVIVVLFALLGVAASILPARRAARLNVLDAIATE